jgi:hypothetical protein
VTARPGAHAEWVADIERRLEAIDERFVDVNRFLLEALTAGTNADPASTSMSRQLADLLNAVNRPASSPHADETKPAGPPGNTRVDELTSLAAWVNWAATAFDLSERWPSCWYRHEGLVFEMQSLRRWHVALATQLTSDPSAPTIWSEALHRVAEHSARRIAQRCLSTHRGSQPLDPIPDDAPHDR